VEFCKDNTVNIPIMYVASIVNGVEYVGFNQIINVLKVVNPNADITYSNLSSYINETRDYLLNSYPKLCDLSVLNERYDKDEFEKKVRNIYGNKILIKPKLKEYEYEIC